jgi:hypothetical protein
MAKPSPEKATPKAPRRIKATIRKVVRKANFKGMPNYS